MNTISFVLVCVQLGKSFTDSSDNLVFEIPLCSCLTHFPISSSHVVSRLNVVVSLK